MSLNFTIVNQPLALFEADYIRTVNKRMIMAKLELELTRHDKAKDDTHSIIDGCRLFVWKSKLSCLLLELFSRPDYFFDRNWGIERELKPRGLVLNNDWVCFRKIKHLLHASHFRNIETA